MRSAQESRDAEFRVAYVMTHYPRVALTYIAGEMDEVERRGGRILPIVMNMPGAEDLTSNEARERLRRSSYLKSSPMRAAAATLGLAASHPIKFAKLVLVAIGSARSDFGIMARRLLHLCYAAAAAKSCRNQNIHHLHAQFGLAPATIAWFAAEILSFDSRARCTWSFTIHGFHDFVNETESRLDLKAASASFVICISDFTKSQLCRVTDLRYWDRFHVIRCGIDLAEFPMRKMPPQREVRRIAIVGRLSPEKGHGILLEAASKLLKAGFPVELEMIGDGPFRDEIRRLATELGIEKSIVLTGELLPDEVARRLADADIFCMASFAEGLPISIMEAMAVGIPVVTTWIGGVPELAVNEVTALTVPPGNSDALAAAIKRLITDPTLGERLSAVARAAVEQRHSQKRNGAKLAEILKTYSSSAVPA